MNNKVKKPKEIQNGQSYEKCAMVSDEAYRQINSTAFRHNFRILIGHYKRVVENFDAV